MTASRLLGVQDAVGAFDGDQAAVLGRKGGMKGTACAGARQRGLRLSRARKESPQRFFHRTRNPVFFGRSQRLARFRIGKNDLSRVFQKNQNRQTVENLPLRIGIRVSRGFSTHGLPGTAATSTRFSLRVVSEPGPCWIPSHSFDLIRAVDAATIPKSGQPVQPKS